MAVKKNILWWAAAAAVVLLLFLAVLAILRPIAALFITLALLAFLVAAGLLAWLLPVVIRVKAEVNTELAQAELAVSWGPFSWRAGQKALADPYGRLIRSVRSAVSGEADAGPSWHKGKAVYSRIDKIRVAAFLRRYLVCRKAHLKLELGLGDPYYTALAYGGLWAFLGTVLSLGSGWVKLRPEAPQFYVQPNFNHPALSGSADCILALPPAHVMIAFLRFGLPLLRSGVLQAEAPVTGQSPRMNEGVGADGRASYSGSDEDRHGKPEGYGGRQHRRRRAR